MSTRRGHAKKPIAVVATAKTKAVTPVRQLTLDLEAVAPSAKPAKTRRSQTPRVQSDPPAPQTVNVPTVPHSKSPISATSTRALPLTATRRTCFSYVGEVHVPMRRISMWFPTDLLAVIATQVSRRRKERPQARVTQAEVIREILHRGCREVENEPWPPPTTS